MENNNINQEGLTEEQKKELDEQLTNLGEIYSQCWESEEFKQAFIKDPKAIFDEYDVKYDPTKEYRVIDSPAKTLVNVLPYENCKQAFELYSKKWSDMVADIKDDEAKQILLEGWSWQFVQNTESINYFVIPLCPESLSPEELEMINGGCIVAGVVFLFGAVIIIGALGTTVAAITLTVAVQTFTAIESTGALAIVDGHSTVIAIGEDHQFYSGKKKPER